MEEVTAEAVNEQQYSAYTDLSTPILSTDSTVSSHQAEKSESLDQPSLEPYVGRLERFELFSTNQCYYIIGSNKLNTAYRVIKIDRTLIERIPDQSGGLLQGQDSISQSFSNDNNATKRKDSNVTTADNSHTAKPTLRPLSEFVTEDPNIYSQDEIKDMLDMIHDGNRMTHTDGTPGSVSRDHAGGLKPIVKAYGIVGFIRFLDCYYVTLITKRAKCGSIGGNGIYSIKNTETVPLKPAEHFPVSGPDDLDPSSVLLSMWNRGKRSVGLGLTNREIAELRYQGLYQVVDLVKGFFFSYTYDLTSSLQENFLTTTSKPYPPPPFKDIYAWNHFLTRELEGCLNSMTSYQWIMPIIHGAFVQRKVSDYGKSLNIVLIARRSRHFAGTRYLKRGVSEQGKVANDVEHEQIIHDESRSSSSGSFASFIQVRGSIPTFWSQEGSVTMPKPPIELNRVDPTYHATRLHFEDLMKRYSTPIVVLDLVKQSEKREREVRVGDEYRHAVDYINSTIDDERHRIQYCALDYSHISKHRNLDVSLSLREVSTWSVNQTGFFCSVPKWKMEEGGVLTPFSPDDWKGASRISSELNIPVFPMEQRGVLRTNCIDCLDRTNVAQFSAGVEAIGQQLVVMGIRTKAKLDPSSTIVRVLIDMYVDIGDSIALQYGGSEAHKKVTAERTESSITPIGKHKELLTSIRRYYSNAFTDRLKQDAMNLFLGYYIPYRHSVPLWEMETDYYLHNFHVNSGRGQLYTMKMYEREYGVSGTNDSSRDSITLSRIVQSGLGNNSNRSSRSGLTSGFEVRTNHESARIAKVRQICKAHEYHLSKWWKYALQVNLQQRMWMKLNGSIPESFLPSKYERLYQPDKIAQFDRFFARSWATPVRRSHIAQHSDESENDVSYPDLKRLVTRCDCDGNEVKREDKEIVTSSDVTLDDYLSTYGYHQRFDTSLKLFPQHYKSDVLREREDAKSNNDFSQLSQATRTLYEQYVAPADEVFSGPVTSRRETIDEFQAVLRDYTMSSDDVEGISKLARSAHVGAVIEEGLYSGLRHNASAIEVANAIHEQFNAYESFPRVEGNNVETELQHRGFGTAGVRSMANEAWTSLSRAEEQYTELFTPAPSGCRRSDLTDSNSFMSYCSSFDKLSTLTPSDVAFLLGDCSGTKEMRKDPRKLHNPQPSGKAFLAKAARLGITINPSSPARTVTGSSTLYSHVPRSTDIPAGFEQINDRMYARKDNKFLVLNDTAVRYWNGMEPLTKIHDKDMDIIESITY